MGITFESICEKLGFNPFVNPPEIEFHGHEDDSQVSPYACLSFDELWLLFEMDGERLKQNQGNKH